MSRKRRMFDIEVPDEPSLAAPPAEPRRGPMASAVRENAEALREREALEARIRAENDALAHEHVRLKKQGLILDMIPADHVDCQKLARDRTDQDPAAMAELKASIMAIGLSNPIRVERKEDGRFELIQGWRRLRAFLELEAEHQDGRFAQIPAAYVAAGDPLSVSYRRMVDENLIRKDISFAEMARLAQRYASDPTTDCEDVDKAVATLFRSASYQKRSYIRAFAEMLDAVGDTLRFPERLSRNLGLDLRKRLEQDPAAVQQLDALLARAPARDEEGEMAIVRAFVATPPQKVPAKPAPSRRAKTSLRVVTASGEMRCTAAAGRVELRGDVDFSAVDSARLEDAVMAFVRALGAAKG
jgi:ParB family chromosome partitioning protein